jgi:hypothetical protein
MPRVKTFYAISFSWFAAFAIPAPSQQRAPLRLVQTIPMPGVHGRMDHLGVDIKGKRLFAAALGENQNTVEVIDLNAGERTFGIPAKACLRGFSILMNSTSCS